MSLNEELFLTSWMSTFGLENAHVPSTLHASMDCVAWVARDISTVSSCMKCSARSIKQAVGKLIDSSSTVKDSHIAGQIYTMSPAKLQTQKHPYYSVKQSSTLATECG
ncbi:hypothetical protein T11_11089 [Trichinella zimbabwensis]|uniref:Uncharacterized protein n=1 Tax=Trichinella zimbabwensis TaxID=268475 RepID=A0A0V1I5U1_9BILA|nr:hypothetical protein T11_11089 [Trichinella zimbabwensis]